MSIPLIPRPTRFVNLSNPSNLKWVLNQVLFCILVQDQTGIDLVVETFTMGRKAIFRRCMFAAEVTGGFGQ